MLAGRVLPVDAGDDQLAAAGPAEGESYSGRTRAGLRERDGWVNPKGDLCAASVRNALPRLDRGSGQALPTRQGEPPSVQSQGPNLGICGGRATDAWR